MKDVTAISYLIGLPEEILESRDVSYNRTIFTQIPGAEEMRACCRTRQTLLFHFTTVSRIFALPDTLRAYCPEGLFETLQAEFKRSESNWDMANQLSSRITELAIPVMTALKVRAPEAIAAAIFAWPNHDKRSFESASKQYHSPKLRFPFKCYIPKPSSYGTALYALFNGDDLLYNAAPIELAIQATGKILPSEPILVGTPLPAESTRPITSNENITYIQSSFTPDIIPTVGSYRISYIDFDNIPCFLTALICSYADSSHCVKIYYDDRARKSIQPFLNCKYVETIFVERLKADKSLADARIIVDVMQDCYLEQASQAVLYSSDSDYITLAAPLKQRGMDFSVVGLEGHITRTYIDRLSETARCYILSDKAIIPVLNDQIIATFLRTLLLQKPLAEITSDYLIENILSAMADEKYRNLLYKPLVSAIERVLPTITLSLDMGAISLRLPAQSA